MLLKENRYETIFNSNEKLFKSLGFKSEIEFKKIFDSKNTNHPFFNFIEIY